MLSAMEMLSSAPGDGALMLCSIEELPDFHMEILIQQILLAGSFVNPLRMLT